MDIVIRSATEFDDQVPSARMTFCIVFEFAEICANVDRFTVEGNAQNFDRLAEEPLRPGNREASSFSRSKIVRNDTLSRSL